MWRFGERKKFYLFVTQGILIYSFKILTFCISSKGRLMTKLKNIHPGEILAEEFLIPFNITAYKLAKDIEIPQTRISEILKGNRRITADTALRLSKYFGNSAKL